MEKGIMTKHIEKKCTLGWEKCDDCNYDRHLELFVCAVCGGAESSLTRECPGSPMLGWQYDSVSNGELNYENGEWITYDGVPVKIR